MLVGVGRVKIKGLPNDRRILCVTQNTIMSGKCVPDSRRKKELGGKIHIGK